MPQAEGQQDGQVPPPLRPVAAPLHGAGATSQRAARPGAETVGAPVRRRIRKFVHVADVPQIAAGDANEAAHGPPGSHSKSHAAASDIGSSRDGRQPQAEPQSSAAPRAAAQLRTSSDEDGETSEEGSAFPAATTAAASDSDAPLAAEADSGEPSGRGRLVPKRQEQRRRLQELASQARKRARSPGGTLPPSPPPLMAVKVIPAMNQMPASQLAPRGAQHAAKRSTGGREPRRGVEPQRAQQQPQAGVEAPRQRKSSLKGPRAVQRLPDTAPARAPKAGPTPHRAAMLNALSDDRAKAASELGTRSSRKGAKDAAVGGAGPGNHGNISSGSHASGALKRPSTLRTVKTRGIGSVERSAPPLRVSAVLKFGQVARSFSEAFRFSIFVSGAAEFAVQGQNALALAHIPRHLCLFGSI